MNQLNLSAFRILTQQGGVKQVIIQYTDTDGLDAQKVVEYDDLSVADKAIVDAFETLSTTLMNAV
jgi:hypothetical protein